MRKVLSAVALLLVVVLAGCNQEKAEVTEYLQQLQASNAKMKSLAQEMQNSMAQLQKEIAKSDFSPEEIKTRIAGFADQMTVEKERIEALHVPEKAQALHGVMLKQYETGIALLQETAPVLDIATRMAQASKRLQADPSKREAILKEMEAAKTEMQKLQTRMAELTKQAQQYEQQAREEQKKLQDKFGIKLERQSVEPIPSGSGEAEEQ